MAEGPIHREDEKPPHKRSAAVGAQSARSVGAKSLSARSMGAYGTGIEFICAVLLPGAFGYWLDGRFGTKPALMLVGGGFGFAAGLFRMLRQSRETMR